MAALHPLRVSPAGDVPIDRTLTPTLRLVRTRNHIPTLNPTLTLTLTPNPNPDPDRSSAPHQVPMLSDRHISLRIWMLSQSSTFSRRLDGEICGDTGEIWGRYGGVVSILSYP